jgi:hypothetical protein
MLPRDGGFHIGESMRGVTYPELDNVACRPTAAPSAEISSCKYRPARAGGVIFPGPAKEESGFGQALQQQAFQQKTSAQRSAAWNG